MTVGVNPYLAHFFLMNSLSVSLSLPRLLMRCQGFYLRGAKELTRGEVSDLLGFCFCFLLLQAYTFSVIFSQFLCRNFVQLCVHESLHKQ